MFHQIQERLHDPVVFALPAIALLIAVELLALRFGSDGDEVKRYDPRDHRASILTGLGALVVTTLLKAGSLALYAYIHAYLSPWHLPANTWFTWLLVFVGVDLTIYGYHRMAHRVRVMWAGHQVHHSSEYLNVSTALRRKWAQWFEKLIWIPMVFLGIPPVMIFTMQSLHLIYGLWVHTEKIGKLPRAIEFVLVTPSHHRVHHGSDPEYLDKNYGSILIIWDRLLGSFQPETKRPTYGLTKQIDSFSMKTIQLHEFAAMFHDIRGARGWRDRLGYVFGPPGWHPEADRPTPAGSTTAVPQTN